VASSRLRDVAELAGVSVRTVSNVVNGYATVSDATRAKVERAVAELGYRPNLQARNLRRGTSGMLAMVVPELESSYFTELAGLVMERARGHGFTVLLDHTQGDPGRERELVLHDARASLFDGVILSPLTLTSTELASVDSRTPMVLLGEHPLAASRFDHVGIDYALAAEQAVGHLLAGGRRRIAAIGDQPAVSPESPQRRTQGYLAAHRAAAVEVDPTLLVSLTRFRRHEGAQAMAAVLDRPGPPPDAVFAYNDMLALGALHALHQHGLRVPDDVAVIGFDGTQDARYSTPSLTTVAPDTQQIADLAFERLLARIQAADEPPRSFEAGFELVLRESTGD
jgi:LacI family repressor for deo operon, udp, cdd, tsx, nupC, and nupG